MITLSTLKNATKQEVFNQVAEHLLTQNKKSINDGTLSPDFVCVYRMRDPQPNDPFHVLKCAIGCLISDDEYYAEMEGGSPSTLLVKGTKLSFILDYDNFNFTDIRFLRQLQRIHDDYQPSEWLRVLKNLASSYNLDASIVDHTLEVLKRS